MTYRFQDILRMVIPGLYLITLCFILFAWIGWIDISKESTIHSLVVSPFANTLAILLPFLGFVIGYLVNVTSSLLERKLYRFNLIKRPSAYVLSDLKENTDYYIGNLDKLKVRIDLNGVTKVNNQQANTAFQKAKEAMRKDDNIIVFLAQSVLARNLAGCQIIFTIICIICIFINWKLSLWWGLGSFLLCAIMVYNWWRQRCVYAKYVFAAYNSLEDPSSAIVEKEQSDKSNNSPAPDTTTPKLCPFIAYFKAKHPTQKNPIM